MTSMQANTQRGEALAESFGRQVLRAVLNDLRSRVQPTIQDPEAQATLDMVLRLVAHLLIDAQVPGTDRIDEEIGGLMQQERDEDCLLEDAARSAGAEALTTGMLTPYLRERLQMPELTVTAVDVTLGGYSKETTIVALSSAERIGNALVIRRDQMGGPVAGRAADELSVIEVMHRQGIPVAEPLWADLDPPFTGTVLVTRRVPGRSAFDLTGATLRSGARDAACELARVLARLHAIDVTQLPRTLVPKQETTREHVGRTIAAYEMQWAIHRQKPSPVLQAAFRYLRSHVPRHGGGRAVVHGDASLRNLLVHEGRATALLDWELWHIGDPIEDLAYCRPEVEQIMAWEEFLAEYRRHGGCDYDERIGAYYELLGSVRNAMFGDSCIYGFRQAPVPQARMVFVAVYLARKLIPDVARRLAALDG